MKTTTFSWCTLFGFVAVLALVIGCHSGSGGASTSPSFPLLPGNELARASIGPTGGVVAVNKPESPLHGTTLTVPAGTLATTEVIKISMVSNPIATETITLALQPDGLAFDTTNATPTIVVPYTDQFLADNGIDDPTNIRVAIQNAVSGIVEELTVIARDPIAKTITAAVAHFSIFNMFGSATQPTGFAQVFPEVPGPLKFYPGLPQSTKSERTLLIVHGICSSGQDLIACKNGLLAMIKNNAILRAQYKRVLIYNYPWKRGFNGTHGEPNIFNKPASLLQFALAQVSSSEPHVDILAHSMGGCVSRYALELVDDGRARNAVYRLTMIATPSGGASGGSVIAIGCAILSGEFQAAVDLSPLSVRLEQIARSDFSGFNTHYITLGGDVGSTRHDVFIPPAGLGVAVTSVELGE